ncbi:hypothetical protein [Garciella nitratireducens]|uniref:Uncharacterized protein n=1 Tax=Garciella nitratireducens DSM 15102 TaxID=1121911 RepID=A0A1T4PDH8_9FIRM|nr:hypothetical protein [Garciella nitratireducens]RBP36682.1 hypothetical protein DFR81_1288 [Garciella nitratireducens]SJZ89594.1 hypothetical protein SAMN02745973_02034 [Garciella nitratireducens DSM 15102]
MKKKKKENCIIKSVIIGNFGHIVLSFITGIIIHIMANFESLSFYEGFKNAILFILFILTLGFWFYMGILSTKYDREDIYKTGIITAIISILPAAFFTIISSVFSIYLRNADGLTIWNAFYIFGGPTLFWHRPFSFIIQLVVSSGFKGNGYFIYFIDLLLIALVIFTGAIFFGTSKNKRIVSEKSFHKNKKENPIAG